MTTSSCKSQHSACWAQQRYTHFYMKRDQAVLIQPNLWQTVAAGRNCAAISTLTTVGDTKHLDRLNRSKRQEKTYCTSLFSFIFLQDLLTLTQITTSPQELVAIQHVENTALRQRSLFKRLFESVCCWLILVLLSKPSHENWQIISALYAGVWHQTSTDILCSPKRLYGQPQF